MNALQTPRTPSDSDQPGILIHSSSEGRTTIEVRDQDRYRSLYLGSPHLQSRMSLDFPPALVLTYTQYMVLPVLLQQPQKILIVGVGAGSLVRFFHYHFQGCRIDGVDNSQSILNVAGEFFQLPADNRVKFHCCDGFTFLTAAATTNYDLILVDAFDGEGMAAGLYNQAFLAACHARLAPHGMLSMNLWSGKKFALRHLLSATDAVFADMLTVQVPNRGNIVALAAKTPISRDFLEPKDPRLTHLSRKLAIDFRELLQATRPRKRSWFRRLLDYLDS